MEEASRRHDSGWELGISGHARNEVVAVLRFDVYAVGDVSVEIAIAVHLVRLDNEAVIVAGPLGVVARIGVDADGLEARGVVVGCEWVVVGCSGIGASCDFEFIADAVLILNLMDHLLLIF